MQLTKTVVLSRQEMIDDLLPIIVVSLSDSLTDYLKDRDFLSGNESHAAIGTNLQGVLSGDISKDKDLIQFWRDLCAETFFVKHVDVTDVLMEKSSDGTLKEWVACRQLACA